ncbi:MAG: ABC transporter ATP-binding protein [Clostridia bacterium]|nr:ABC transporter ATP-binding protein [Clostridia bacterium]
MQNQTTERQVILGIENLSKFFGKKQVLHNISFDTYAGEVFGFLGPNGAGKTTLIKTVVGHLMIDDGNVSICGKTLKKDFEGAMANVGGIIESPEFYKYMSGYDNLLQYARLRGVEDEARVKEVVHLVGLDNRIHDKVGKYSLGMRQRLGVAQAILHRPKLLVLDEPTNGLDPAGIKELRNILKRIAHEEDASVLVSSHLMSEMELMCDRVGVIVGGNLIDVKPIDELVSSTAMDKSDFIFETGDGAAVFALLDFIPAPGKTLHENGDVELVIPKANERELLARINREVVQAGIDLYSVSRKENKRLEDVFMELTGSEGDDQIG